MEKRTIYENLKKRKIWSDIKKSQNIMNMIVGSHQAINNDIWRYLKIIFRQYVAIILKIYVRFTLKELRCELSSSFYIILGSEQG